MFFIIITFLSIGADKTAILYICRASLNGPAFSKLFPASLISTERIRSLLCPMSLSSVCNDCGPVPSLTWTMSRMVCKLRMWVSLSSSSGSSLHPLSSDTNFYRGRIFIFEANKRKYVLGVSEVSAYSLNIII